MDRRQVLFSLAAIPVSVGAGLPGSAAAQDGDGADTFLRVSRVLTGDDSLTPQIAARIEAALRQRDDSFGDKLSALAKAMTDAGGDRAAQIAALDEAALATALAVATPWYLGYVGKPSGLKLTYEAEFVTFLEAQAYDRIQPQVPRPTYPPGGPGWWVVVPQGVTSPPMPKEITRYGVHPAAQTRTIQDPDPAWLSYANAKHATYEAALAARPTSGAVPIDTMSAPARSGGQGKPATDPQSAPQTAPEDQ